MKSLKSTIIANLRAALEEGNEFEAARLLNEALRVGHCDPSTLSLQCRQLRPPIRSTAPWKHVPSRRPLPV